MAAKHTFELSPVPPSGCSMVFTAVGCLFSVAVAAVNRRLEKLVCLFVCLFFSQVFVLSLSRLVPSLPRRRAAPLAVVQRSRL